MKFALLIIVKLVLFIFVDFILCYFISMIDFKFDPYKFILYLFFYGSFPIFLKFNIRIYGLYDFKFSEKAKSIYWYSVIFCGDICGVIIFGICKELGIIDDRFARSTFPLILVPCTLILYSAFFPLFVKIASNGDRKCF